jgi:hypothetical protein
VVARAERFGWLAARQAGGLEGCKPSQNLFFLVVVASLTGNNYQKMEILGRQSLPKPDHR